jgi:3'(2'), 5'-bisphosphate nucleotidase
MTKNITIAIEAAIEAGKEILKVYNSNSFQVEIKEDNSPLTAADKAAHNIIDKYLSTTNIPILSEEGNSIPYEERKQWGKLWIVDPLDGTKEFIKRNGEFTVNIALVSNNKPIVGVIYVPVSSTLYLGIVDHGCWKVESITEFSASTLSLEELKQRGSKLPQKKETSNYVVVASRSHLSDETIQFIEELKTKHGELDFQSRGSSLKLCVVAEGQADIYPRFAPTMEWDTAAGHAIVEAAGGEVALSDGSPLLYNRENLRNNWFIARK